MRLFVAVWPPPDVVAALAGLPRPVVPGVRWTRREAWHVTLRFLGEVEDPAPVAAALDRAALAPASARLGPRLTALGRRVLAVPVAGLDELAAGVGAPVASSSRPGPGDQRAFRGHVTLARARRGGDVRPLAGATVQGGWRVDAVELVLSRPEGRGHRYEVLHRRPLGARPPGA
ncbi:MAG TPA: RNA 2',3'-cyclic phosphodiesterase [Acidimicrobiales bacterium]|nr:RNA 2',3'-cyclic phosphodiesterase [Acidimicrobiales bacterium]